MSAENRSKFRITQTLLSSYQYIFKMEDGYESFLKTLRREKSPPTKAMLDGQQFENIINAVLDGAPMDASHEWYEPISEIVPELMGAQKQVTLFKDITVNGVPFLLHGVLDFLKAGVITDTKFSKTYSVGKYRDSPQHPMYFALAPEAYEFRYTISDGKWVYREAYRPDEVEPIEHTISHFMDFLDKHDLVDIYVKNWTTKN